jgi:RHS repeat-associated protein
MFALPPRSLAPRIALVNRTSSFTYDAFGERIVKTTGSTSTYFAYDQAGHMQGEYDGNGALIEEIVWMGDTPVASLRMTSCGLGIFYIHTDHLNTPRRITRRTTSDIVWEWDSDPFGAAPNTNPSGLGTFTFNLRFAGQYYDSETGLNYNYYRDYDPAVGRYVESDPIGLRGGANPYTYALNSPINYGDPLGLNPVGELIGYLWERLPKRDDCRDSEWSYCTAYCAPARAVGCYVTLSWKLKGIRNDRPFRSQQRLVNCRCEDIYNCQNAAPKKEKPGGSSSAPWLTLPPWWWETVTLFP